MGPFKKTLIAFYFFTSFSNFNVFAEDFTLTMEHSLTKSEYDSILEEMGNESKALRQMDPVKEVVFVLRNTEKKIFGSLVAYVFHGSLMIDVLFIDKKSRMKGYGSKLVRRAISFAKKADLDFVSVSTMDFWNAVPFYKKHGFFVEHISYGYKNNSIMYTMRTTLN